MDPIVGVLIGVAVVGVVGGFYWFRGRRPKEEPVFHFRCPGCKRRLRYRARQVGHRGECSHCRQAITFPPVSQSIQ
jgi:hypothetical protein